LTTQNFIEKLKTLGFKEYESKVFIVLLKGIPMSASDIAKDAKIIRNSIYDILKSFVQKGYCNEIETDTILNYQIIDPAIIMDKIEHDYNESYKERVSNLKDTFGELQSIYKTKSAKSEKSDIGIQLIRGFNMHRVAKYMELVKSAKREWLGMYRLKGLVTEELDEDARRLIKSGGTVRSIYQASLDFKVKRNGKSVSASKDDLLKVCETFRSYGEDLRLSEFKIPNIAVFDKESVFINMSGDRNIPKHKQADIIIKNNDFAEHMGDLFEHYWSRGLTIEEFKKKV